MPPTGVQVIDGFVEHYLVVPLIDQEMTPAIRIAVVGAWVLPSVVGYRRLWLSRTAVAS